MTLCELQHYKFWCNEERVRISLSICEIVYR